MGRWSHWVTALGTAAAGWGCTLPDRPAADAVRPPAASQPPADDRATAPRGQAPSGPTQLPAPRQAPADKPAVAPQPAPATKPAALPADQPLTLDYLEDVALQVNPILRRDVAQIDAARGQAVQAGLFPNPRFDTNNPWVFNGRNTLLNAGFQQEIPVMGKKRLDQAAATENTRQQEFTSAQDRFTLLSNVWQQFYTVLADQQRVEVLTQLANLVRQSYEAGVKKQKAGEATQADVLLLRIDLQRVEANLRGARATLDGDRKRLGAIVGVPGLVDRPVVGTLTGGYPDFDEARLLGYVATDHTAVQNARSVVVQNQFQLRRAEVEPYPNPYLGPAYQFGLVPGNDQFWFNFQFSIPVWDRNQGNIRAAKANLAASIAQVGATRNDLVNQVAMQLSQYLTARALVEEFERSILPQSREAARLTREGYTRAGNVDLATFLQAQRTLIQANSDYVDALQSLWTNAAQVAGLLQLTRFPAAPASAQPPAGPTPAPAPVPNPQP